jgi:hypothetical protein
LCLIASGEDLTVSKDSLRVYNNLAMSFADEVVFTSHASAAIHLDSVRIAISEMDTVGFSHAISINGFQACWRTNVPSVQSFVWTMDVTGPNTYLLTKNIFDPGSAEPLVFSGNNTTSQIVGLEVGMFLFGETRPQYPKYFRGTMMLYFSNGQVLELKLWSQDLRTGVKRSLLALSGVEASRVEVHPLFPNAAISVFSMNGKNITAEAMNGNLIGKSGIIIVKVNDNGRIWYSKETLVR